MEGMVFGTRALWQKRMFVLDIMLGFQGFFVFKMFLNSDFGSGV